VATINEQFEINSYYSWEAGIFDRAVSRQSKFTTKMGWFSATWIFSAAVKTASQGFVGFTAVWNYDEKMAKSLGRARQYGIHSKFTEWQKLQIDKCLDFKR